MDIPLNVFFFKEKLSLFTSAMTLFLRFLIVWGKGKRMEEGTLPLNIYIWYFVFGLFNK